MKNSAFRRIIAGLLVLMMLFSCIPGTYIVKAEETAPTVQEMLGDNWILSWNGGSLDATEYLEIVEGGYHGNFALRFGHPTEATQLTLRYKLLKTDLGVAETTGIDWNLSFAGKLDGAFSSNTYIGLINPVASPGGNNRKNLSLSSLGSEWTVLNPNKSYDNKLWCPTSYTYAMAEFAIKLDAGNYFYLDDFHGSSRTSTSSGTYGEMKWVNIVHNGSFEKWYGSYNETAAYTQDSDFVNIVDGGYNSDHALRLGNASKATNYTLQMHMPASGTNSFALMAKTEGTVTKADFEMINGLDGTGTVYSLAGIGTDWTAVSHAAGLTDVAVDSGTVTARLHVELPAGSYLYVDDVQIIHGYDATMPDLLSDGGFEGDYCLHYYDTTWESSINTLQKKLGKNWYVSWNGGAAADAEYVNIVEGGNHGNYSLRIGHPTESTSIALRYRLYKTDLGLTSTTAVGVGMKFAARVEGTLKSSSYVAVINPVDPATGNNRVNLPAEQLSAIGSDWSTVNESKSGDILYLWSSAEHDHVRLEFSIKLDAGNYFYLDELQGYSLTNVAESTSLGNMKGVNVVHNGSFERWDCTWNAQGEQTNAEFAQIMEGGRSGNVLRLGNAEKDTDYTLQLPLEALVADGYSFDLWAKLEGTANYASFELFDGTTDDADARRYSLADVGTEWTHISHEYDVTDVWVESGTLLVQLYVNLPAGSYLYLDDIHIAKEMSSVYYSSYPNLLSDGMFQGYALGFQQPALPTAPEFATFVGAHKNPTGWYQTWAGKDQYDTRHLTSEAYSGNYALMLSCLESNMDYTASHSLPTLEADAQYTFEGWFKEAGNVGSVSLMYNGSTFKSLKDETMKEWTKFTGTFAATTNTVFSIYAAGEMGSQLLVDDLVIYKSDDESKTNLLTNGDFETVSGAWDEQLKIDKTFTELPVSVEAVLRLPVGTEKGGVILSNYDGANGYTVGVNASGQPYVTAVVADGTVTEGVFTDMDVRTGETVILNISNAEGKLTCSVNGEVQQALEIAVPANAELYAKAFAVAGDNTYKNANYFTGALISVSVSGAEGEIASWNLERLDSPFTIADITGNGYDIVYMGEWFDELPDSMLSKYSYAFAAVGDTQYTNRGDTERSKDYLGNLYQWIVDNQGKYNIQAVLGMGDITDTKASLDDETTMTKTNLEWDHAVESIGKLNTAGIPYTLVRGNHDFVTTDPRYTTSLYDEHMLELGYDAVVDGWYEEGETLAAAYLTLTVGQTDWLILTLDYDYNAQDIAWASGVISAHPDHKVIVTTHAHLNWAGNWQTADGGRELLSKDLWNMLLSQHDNIELMLCGHVHSDTILYNQRDGKGQNVVTEMLIDTQTHDDQYYVRAGKAPYAVVTLMLFTEDGSEVMVANYATGKNKFYKAEGVKTFDLSNNDFGEQSNVEQWNLTLGENVGAQFYMNIEEAIAADENAQLKITVADKVTYAAIPEANEAGQYVFSIDVAAAQMTDEIKLQLVSGVQAGPEYTYSIRGYADYILDEANGYDDATRNLVTAMLVYGGKAQTYFGYNTDAMADADITAGASTAVPEDSGLQVQDNLPGIRFYGASLLLQSKTAIRYYFSITDDIAQYTFTDGSGNGLTAKASGQYYYVELGSINPAELDGDFAVTVTKAESAGAISIGYNAVSYMARMYYNENTQQALKDLAQAMYDYHLAAKTYTAA